MNPTVQYKIIKWLADGETGLSSETMAFWLGWNYKRKRVNHPYDPSDFNRCLGLLRAAPELRSEIPKLAKLSATWAKLVKHWPQIETSFSDEVGEGWCKARSAPITYALMKKIGC